MKKIFLFIGLTMIALLYLYALPMANEPSKKIKSNTPQEKSLSNINYDSVKAEVSSTRKKLLEFYLQQDTAGKKSCMDSIRKTFIDIVTEKITPCWIGTPWDFNGTTLSPGHGSIACGYFVTTVLQDAGVHLQRIAMAQCASEPMIKTLVSSGKIKRYRNCSLTDFLKAVQQSGSGLYIVGLDFHTGFLLNDGNEIYFIHSKYNEQTCVIKEKAKDSAILASSQYRVTGALSADDIFLVKWLNEEKF